MFLLKRIIKSFSLLLVLSLLFSTNAFAKNDHAKESLVALGDSIPYGYNLGETNEEASKDAFPYLIGDDGYLRVRNLAVPGLNTTQMLTSLKTDQKFRQAVRHADYITLNIGSNDLLQALRAAYQESNGNQSLFMLILQQKVQNSNLFANIGDLIKETRTLTDAPIVTYNIYNPFQTNDPLHYVGLQVLPSINKNFSDLTTYYNAVYGNVLLADAYTAFGQNQGTYVIAGDIHPTIEGQILLADIGSDALDLNEEE